MYEGRMKLSIQDILTYRLPNHAGKRLTDPHVVIVGAGASIAACKTDKNGKRVPLLKNIHNRLHTILQKYSLPPEFQACMLNFPLTVL